MGTAVAVAEQRGVMSINLANVNYKTASSAADKFIGSVGGSAGTKNFPGKQISFKKGVYSLGFGDKATRLKEPRLVVNGPNAIATWVKWVDKKPVYAEPRWPAAGDDPITRESLGDTDQDDWETDENGQIQDPWKPVLVLPCRNEDDDQLNHIFLGTKSSVIAGFNLFKDIMDEMKMHAGELPVVVCTSDKAEMKRKITVKGKEKEQKLVWDIPVFEIVDWVKAEDCDNPAKGGVKVTTDSEDDGDMGAVKTTARKAVAAPKKEEKEEKAAPKGKQTRRQVEVDDDEI